MVAAVHATAVVTARGIVIVGVQGIKGELHPYNVSPLLGCLGTPPHYLVHKRRHDPNQVVSASQMSIRIIEFDFIKGIACLMVFGIHILQMCISKFGGGMPQNIVYFLMTPCDGLFFMVTGCLLLRDSRLSFNFFIRRVVDVFVPVILISMLIMLCRLSSDLEPHQNIFSVFWKPVSPSYWFFYALVGIYLLTVPMNNLYHRFGVRFLRYAVMVWFIEIGTILVLVAIGLGVAFLDIICENPVALSVFFWGFLPLGKYIWLMVEEKCMYGITITAITVLILGIGGVITFVDSPSLHEYLFQNYLSPMSIGLTVCVFYLFLKSRLNKQSTPCIEFLGRHSVWFCLLHVLPWVLWQQM